MKKQNEKKRRLLSLLLCGAILFSLCAQPVFAESGAQTPGGSNVKSADGLCEHHTRHDDDCGYAEGTAGTACTHKHTDDCYIEITRCLHKHGEDCYSEEENSTLEQTSTPSDAEKREPENCPHICTRESGCITEKLDCRHQHSGECGYTPAKEGTPCGYVCGICGANDNALSGERQKQIRAASLARESASGDFGTNNQFHWDLTDGVLTISGSGEMPGFGYEAARPWHTYKDEIKKAVIENGVTSVGNYAFSYCGNLTKITLPDNITKIGSYAFGSCSQLDVEQLPDTVESIGSGAFWHCENLTLTSLPTNVTSIDVRAFESCKSLALTALPAGLTVIKESTFSSCSSLALTKLPDSVTTIKELAFNGCTSLPLEKLPDGITTIGNYAFNECWKLALTDLPEHIETIGNWAFNNCKSIALTKLPDNLKIVQHYTFSNCSNLALTELPAGLTDIWDYAFVNCAKLELTEIPGSVKSIGSSAFAGCTGLTDLTFTRNPAPALSYGAFDRCSNLTIHIPEGATGYDNKYGTSDKIAHKVTVQAGANGSASASFAEAKQGTEIVLTATPDSGYHLKEWQVTDGGITVTDNRFAMPAMAVTIQAVFEQDIAPAVTDQPQDQTIAAGQTATFAVTVIGAPAPALQWQVNKDGSGWENISGAADSSYTTEKADKPMDGWKYRCLANSSLGSAVSDEALLTVHSVDAGIQSVSVDGTEGTISGTEITVVLPYGITPPADPGKISVIPAAGAAVSALATADGGTTWTFTVTAEDGTTAENYTINVSNAPNPAAGNIADVAAAKANLQSTGWRVDQSEANTETAVKAWIEHRLQGMELNSVTCTVSITGFTAAAAGSKTDRDGTDGSFSFAIFLSKGEGNTLAEDTISEINGTITALPYQAEEYMVSVSASPADGGTVSGGGTYAENTSATVEAFANNGYHFVKWTEDGSEVSTSASYTFTVTGSRSLAAMFEKDSEPQPPQPAKYSVTVETEGSGTASASPVLAAAGTEITLSAAPGSGYSFKEWQVISGNVSISENRFTMPDKNVTIKAVFEMDSSNNHGGGSYSGGSHGRRRSLAAPAYGNEHPSTGTPFADVLATDWFSNDVMFINETGLMADGSAASYNFNPGSNADRILLPVIFYRMEGSPKVEGRNNFTDVEYGPGSVWYYDAVTWAQQNGIIGGYENGKFGFGDSFSREQIAAVLYIYAQHKGYDVTAAESLDRFTDKDSTSAWAQEALTWAVSSGILDSTEDNLLSPQGNITRAQLAVILRRFIDKYALAPAATPSGTTSWQPVPYNTNP